MSIFAEMLLDQSVQDYTSYAGQAPYSAEAVQNLHKAMMPGPGMPAMTGGAALQVQSLDATLRVLTATLKNIVLWPLLNKEPAISTTAEYNLLTSFGADNGAFIEPGGLPQLQDAAYQRRAIIMKYMATQREIAHPQLLVRSAHGNIVGIETKNGATWLLQQLESALLKANSAIIPQQFDGLDAQFFAHPSFYPTQVKDLRGRYPTEDDFEEACNAIGEQFGTATHAIMAPAALSAYSRQFYARQRIPMPATGYDGSTGFVAKTYDASTGTIQLRSSVFNRAGNFRGIKRPPTSATSAFSPPPPAALAGSVPGGAGSYFTGTAVGTYRYWATAVNRMGESAPTQIAADLTFAAGQSSTLTVTSGGGTTTGFKLYRGPVGSTSIADAQIIRELPASGSYVDNNYLLPGMSRVYIMQINPLAVGFKMLAPLIKVPLATLALSIRWIQAIYGVPISYNPLWNYVFLNVPDSGTVNP